MCCTRSPACVLVLKQRLSSGLGEHCRYTAKVKSCAATQSMVHTRVTLRVFVAANHSNRHREQTGIIQASNMTITFSNARTALNQWQTSGMTSSRPERTTSKRGNVLNQSLNSATCFRPADDTDLGSSQVVRLTTTNTCPTENNSSTNK